MKDKLTIAICGLMDSGKSTLIKTVMKAQSGRTVEPDALCLEQETGKTITGTRIACPVDEQMDLVMIDCPGHMEYLPEIVSGLCAADAYIMVIDEERVRKSQLYAEQLSKIADALGCPQLCTIHSHSSSADLWHYDINSSTFNRVLEQILGELGKLSAKVLLKTPRAKSDGKSSRGQNTAFLASVVWLNNEKGSQQYNLIFHGLDAKFPVLTTIDRDKGKIINKFLLLHKPKEIDLPPGTRILICSDGVESEIVGVGRVLNP